MILNRALLIDLDGTISNDSNRVDLVDKTPPDVEKYHAYARYDKPNAWCAEIVRLFQAEGYVVIFISGRPESMRAETVTWLTSHLPFLEGTFKLLLRDEHDPEDTVEFKKHRYFADIAPLYDVEFAIEDRLAPARMWRSVGVPTLLCEERE